MTKATVRNEITSPAMDENQTDVPDHVIVGVDIGHTCTGVAIWSRNPPHQAKFDVIRDWPGSNGIVGKVPTAITYRAGSRRPISWGLGCPKPGKIGPGMSVKRLFKFFFEEEFLREMGERNPEGLPGDIDDVRMWYRDFLGELHSHVRARLEDPYRVDSKLTKLEYIFSLPTAWKDKKRLIEDFEDMLKQVGFGEGENSSVVVGLTEAEASAVQAAVSRGHKYKDVSLLRVGRIEGEVINMELLDTPKALFIGSVQIDEAFEKKAERDLMPIRVEHPELSRYTAQEMALEAFQDVKLRFGTKRETLLATHLVVPDLNSTHFGVPDLNKHRIRISRDEIKAMFDEQLVKIFELIDMQLEDLRQKQPSLNVSYIVLSGGLGSSKYIQDEFEARFADKEVLFDKDPEEPPLSVCKGLVLDHVQRVYHGTSVLRKRLCRASYGILCTERYDKYQHHNQTPVKSPLDGKYYVSNQIDWFIRKGDTITENNPITHRCSRIISRDAPDQHSWHDTIVMSRLPPDCLPSVLNQGDARPISTIATDLGPALFNTKSPAIEMKRRWLVLGKKFFTANYKLLIFIEGESLKFRTRVNGEESRETEAVSAPWIFTRDTEDSGEFQGGLVRESTS